METVHLVLQTDIVTQYATELLYYNIYFLCPIFDVSIGSPAGPRVEPATFQQGQMVLCRSHQFVRG